MSSTAPQLETAGSSILAISADGKGVVMLPRDLREPTKKAALNQWHKLAQRLTKGESATGTHGHGSPRTVAPYGARAEQVVRSLGATARACSSASAGGTSAGCGPAWRKP